MKFFKKLHSNEPIVVVDTDTADLDNTGVQTSAEETNDGISNSPTLDEKKRQEDEEERLRRDSNFQQQVRNEAKRLRVTEQLLSAPHLARVQDALRLNETKMANLEENLDRTRKQQERVRRYQELTMEMREQKKHLFEVNKQLAASINERDALERFEEFENVQGQFQRLMVLESLRREQKQRLSELTRELDTSSKRLEEEQKLLSEKMDELRDAERKLSLGMDAVGEAQQLEGRSAFLAIQERKATERANSQTSMQTALEKELEEHRRNMEALSQKIESLRTRRQTLAPHQRMALHGELVVERLSRLSTHETELAKAEQQQKESIRKQTDENELLGRVYTDYQQVEQDIQSLQDELSVHRENNVGLESYRLQERAMKLKLRREMLLSAQSLWTRIANGYIQIEDVLQNINSMRLKQESLAGNISNLEKELNVLRRTTHEKEYTFTLSKSQNVIQLRSDLKEGTNCTVCGATHHPYHSDTILEQNKLIGEIKMEYEAMAAELRAKEHRLREMELENAGISATKEEAENTLIILRELQNGYTRDWMMYTNLDRTFQTCDSSVNADARTAMLRQLVENIGTEVDQAQKELDTFNFHQKRINELSEQIAKLEQKKNELITRLNEVNTGCQVMAGHLDRVQTMKQNASDTYTRLFETLDKMITIPDWQTIWKRSHEALLMRVQELTKEWNDLEEQLKECEHQRTLQEQKLAYMQEKHQELLMQINQSKDDAQEARTQQEEDAQKLEKLVGKVTSKQYLQQQINDLMSCKQNLDHQQEKTFECQLKKQETQGHKNENELIGASTDERAALERQGVDIWMRQYNANHPPVQYNELEEIFSTDRNWNDMRASLRDTQMDALLTQARVDKLGSQLIALQAEGSLNDNDTDVVQHQMALQIETLEARRRETMMTIATLTQQLNAHEKAELLIKEEKMKEK